MSTGHSFIEATSALKYVVLGQRQEALDIASEAVNIRRQVPTLANPASVELEVAQSPHLADQESTGGNLGQTATQPTQETTMANGDANPAQALPVLPPPPQNATARVEEDHVLITWEPSPALAGRVRYRVMRGLNRAPLSPSAGTPVVTDTGRHNVSDTGAPSGADLYYSVFASTGGETWSRPAVAPPLVFTPDVTAVSVAAENTSVSVSWTRHRDTSGVLVVRSEGYPPEGLDDGITVKASLSGFADNDIHPGIRYFYRIVAIYPAPDGRDRRSAGIVVSTVPTVSGLSARRMHDEVRLTWLWPDDATDAVVRWPGGKRRYSRRAYDHEGGVTLVIGPEETPFDVCAVYPHSGGWLTAPPVAVRVPARSVAVTYRVRRASWLRPRRQIIEFSSERATHLPAIVIVRATGQMLLTIQAKARP